MIKIENKTLQSVETTPGVKMTYAEIINFGIGTLTVTQGHTWDQFEFVINLKKTLKEANGTIELDKDQLDYIQKSLPLVPWKEVTEEMLDFKNFILEAK